MFLRISVQIGLTEQQVVFHVFLGSGPTSLSYSKAKSYIAPLTLKNINQYKISFTN